jgi:hypothetical protein
VAIGLPAPIKFLVEIAATLMARYRMDELKAGDVSLLIGLLGKIGCSPGERGKMDWQPIVGEQTPQALASS